MLAEDKGEYSGEFWCLADCIFNKLGDKEWAVKVYKKAEESAGYSDEFENLAESVRENLGDKKWAELLDHKAKELEDDE